MAALREMTRRCVRSGLSREAAPSGQGVDRVLPPNTGTTRMRRDLGRDAMDATRWTASGGALRDRKERLDEWRRDDVDDQ